MRNFPHPRTVLPVIHVVSLPQAIWNCLIARNAGADGVFLINHDISDSELLRIHKAVADQFPDWWIGVNCLGLRAHEVFSKISERVDGVWVDNAMIEEGREEQPEAERILRARRESGWNGLYFGGVAFKYQRPVEDLAKAAKIASRYMDVVTTSGPGTGRAADLTKIRAMKDALGDLPLAIASGITPENVTDYLPIADSFLVATGISRSFEELDPDLTAELVKTVHDESPPNFKNCRL